MQRLEEKTVTCKDCICSEVCYYKAFNDEKHLKKRRDDVEKICKSFAHRDSLKNAPTVDAVPVVHGRWIRRTDYPMKYECSECGHLKDFSRPYCELCGAKMDGDGNG